MTGITFVLSFSDEYQSKSLIFPWCIWYPHLILLRLDFFVALQDFFPQIIFFLNSVYNLQPSYVSNTTSTLFKHLHFIFTYYCYYSCCCYFGDFWSCFAERIRIVLNMSIIYLFENVKISSWKSHQISDSNLT